MGETSLSVSRVWDKTGLASIGVPELLDPATGGPGLVVVLGGELVDIVREGLGSCVVLRRTSKKVCGVGVPRGREIGRDY